MRVWADGKPLDLTGLTVRTYIGDETQTPDPLIVAKDGVAPAYRGLAYVVFERLPLENFGNRIPQLSFEVVRPIGQLEKWCARSRSSPAPPNSATRPRPWCRRSAPASRRRKTAMSLMRRPT